MKLLYFYLEQCYPCERARKVLNDHFSHLDIHMESKREPLAKSLGVRAAPTLVLLDEDGEPWGSLQGAHMITKINLEGLLSDFLDCQKPNNQV